MLGVYTQETQVFTRFCSSEGSKDLRKRSWYEMAMPSSWRIGSLYRTEKHLEIIGFQLSDPYIYIYIGLWFIHITHDSYFNLVLYIYIVYRVWVYIITYIIYLGLMLYIYI